MKVLKFFAILENFHILTFFVYCHKYHITAHPYGVEFHQQPCICFRLRHFRCKEFYLLVLWIWNQNIAIATIVGTLSHINLKEKYEICKNVDVEGTLSSFIYFKT